MKYKILLILFFFAFSCVETEKPKKAVIVDKVTKKEIKVQRPTLDSFFESVSEEREFAKFEEEEVEKEIKFEETLLVPSKKALKIAVILPVTGVYQKLGSEGLDLTIFLEQKMGSKLEMKVFDTESRKNTIPRIAKEISNEGFNLIVGPIFNFETVELSAIEKSVPIISLSNDKEIKKQNVLVFGQNPEDPIKDIVTFFSQQDKKNFMAIFPNSPVGSRFYRVFKRSADLNKSEVMRVEFYDETGISDVSKYVSKITNGLIQKTYISKEDGKVVPERKIRELLAKEPKLNLETLYDITEKKAEVLYISASSNYLNQIIKILKQPSNQVKLKDVFVVIADFENMDIKSLSMHNNFFFYANNYYGSKAFNKEFSDQMGYNPSRLTSLIYDAVAYAVYVNNGVFGSLDTESLKQKTKDFEGINGKFYFNENVVRRSGKVVVIKNGIVTDLAVENKKSERMQRIMKALDVRIGDNINKEDNEDLD